jgi:thiazole synthase
VLGPPPFLYPDMRATFEAAEALIRDGFEVMVYCADDPVAAKRLEEMGCVAIMPLGAPIGSGMGVVNPYMIGAIKREARVPVLVDAGIGTASDAALAMELGCDAVLLNSAIAHAGDPVRMSRAMKHAVMAGRDAFLAGRMGRDYRADASSPGEGLIR